MADRFLTLPPGAMGLDPSKVRGPCAAGCDIRPGSWDLTIGDVLLSPITGRHVVRPVFIGKLPDEYAVLSVMVAYRTRFGVADARPESTLCGRLQKAAQEKNIAFWRAEYNTAPSSIEIQENVTEGKLKLDRTMTLDHVHWAFTTGLDVIIPQNFREITGGQFMREMCASNRIPTKWMGKDCYLWQESGPDHAFHSFNYMLTAVRKSNLLMFGSSLTMGATKGIVSSSLKENISTIETGSKPANPASDPEPAPTIDWKKILQDDDLGSLVLEA